MDENRKNAPNQSSSSSGLKDTNAHKAPQNIRLFTSSAPAAKFALKSKFSLFAQVQVSLRNSTFSEPFMPMALLVRR